MINNTNNKLPAAKHFIIPALSIFLSGCAGMSSKFDCDVDSGGKCAPMHHINQMANYGAFSEKVPATQHAPTHSDKKVHQIWIAPYEDSSGNYHEATHVHMITKK